MDVYILYNQAVQLHRRLKALYLQLPFYRTKKGRIVPFILITRSMRRIERRYDRLDPLSMPDIPDFHDIALSEPLASVLDSTKQGVEFKSGPTFSDDDFLAYGEGV